MKLATITCALVAAGALGILGAPLASAEGPSTTTLGSQAKLVDAAGNVVQGWTVTGLKVSTDVIPYPVGGTLWEATATDEAVQGGVTPVVSNLNARARDGENYRVLFGVGTPQGVNPATLAQGEKTTGKVYFDVTGPAPDSVVYTAGDEDLLVWVQPPPQPRRSGGGYSSGSNATSTTAPAEAPATPAVDGTTTGTPAAAGTGAGPGAPLPTGSQGTPIPAGSQGTPIPTGSQGTPAPAAQGAPVPQPASVGGSQGTPLIPASPTPVVPVTP